MYFIKYLINKDETSLLLLKKKKKNPKLYFVKSQEFMVYNYVNFINIIYDKELLALNYSKLNAFMLIYCGLYIIYNIIYFITFEVYFSYISHTFNNKFSSFEVKSMIKDFLYGSIYSPSTQFFNLCVSWNING